mmetsp:Transcript_7444/g.23258  ORF Transcript_7444/g.23258 Transcript_7444/m.23258 type:complete len:859 (+) Transcript_7444:1383-3959(+)
MHDATGPPRPLRNLHQIQRAVGESREGERCGPPALRSERHDHVRGLGWFQGTVQHVLAVRRELRDFRHFAVEVELFQPDTAQVGVALEDGEPHVDGVVALLLLHALLVQHVLDHERQLRLLRNVQVELRVLHEGREDRAPTTRRKRPLVEHGHTAVRERRRVFLRGRTAEAFANRVVTERARQALHEAGANLRILWMAANDLHVAGVAAAQIHKSIRCEDRHLVIAFTHGAEENVFDQQRNAAQGANFILHRGVTMRKPADAGRGCLRYMHDFLGRVADREEQFLHHVVRPKCLLRVREQVNDRSESGARGFGDLLVGVAVHEFAERLVDVLGEPPLVARVRADDGLKSDARGLLAALLAHEEEPLERLHAADVSERVAAVVVDHVRHRVRGVCPVERGRALVDEMHQLLQASKVAEIRFAGWEEHAVAGQVLKRLRQIRDDTVELRATLQLLLALLVSPRPAALGVALLVERLDGKELVLGQHVLLAFEVVDVHAHLVDHGLHLLQLLVVDGVTHRLQHQLQRALAELHRGAGLGLPQARGAQCENEVDKVGAPETRLEQVGELAVLVRDVDAAVFVLYRVDELRHDVAQRGERLVDGDGLLHRLPGRSGLVELLRARQVDEVELRTAAGQHWRVPVKLHHEQHVAARRHKVHFGGGGRSLAHRVLVRLHCLAFARHRQPSRSCRDVLASTVQMNFEVLPILQKVLHFFLVDLDERDVDGGVCDFPFTTVQFLEQCADQPWHEASVGFAMHVTFHRPRFPAPGLAVRENRRVVPRHERAHHFCADPGVHVVLRRIRVKHVVEPRLDLLLILRKNQHIVVPAFAHERLRRVLAELVGVQRADARVHARATGRHRLWPQ